MLGRILTAATWSCLVAVTAPVGASQSTPVTPPARSVTGDALRERFAARLDEIARAADGVIGFQVVDIATGDRIGRFETTPFPTASTIKVAILYELFRKADEGSIQLDTPEPLPASARAGGSGILGELTQPAMSLRDYATLMIMLSDNTATNLLIDRLGMQAVNARMQALGATGMKLRRRMMDLEAARRGDENVAAPADFGRLLEAIHRGTGLTPASRDGLLEILRKPKDSALRRGVPETLRVANKTGGLGGVEADVAVVEVPGRPYVLSVMGTWLNSPDEGRRAIEQLSRTSYEYFKRLATGSDLGRDLR